MDPDKIKGNIQRPYNAPKEKEGPNKIDPDKFKKVMKIDESEETQKKQKRNLSKQQEEGDEEGIQEEASLPPPPSFSQYMNDQDPLDNVLDQQSPGVRRQTTPQDHSPWSPPSSEPVSTEEKAPNQESSSPRGNTSSQPPRENEPELTPYSQDQQPSLSNGYQQSRDTLPSSQKEPEKPTFEQHEKKDASNPTEKPTKKGTRRKKKTQATDASLLATQPKTKSLKALKKKRSKKPAPKVKVISEEKKTSSSKGVKTKEKNPPPLPEEKTEKPSPFHRFTPEEMRNQKIKNEDQEPDIEGVPIPVTAESGAMGQQGKKKDEDSFIEANNETAGIPLPTFDHPLPPITPVAETPAYSKLSPEMHELFETIGGVMMIEQDKGITTTTMTLRMPGSVFDGTQVILDQYSTAPSSYNIQLVGNPSSLKVFNQNLDALKASFEQANFAFETNILKPILNTGKKSPHLIRRAKNGRGKGGRGNK